MVLRIFMFMSGILASILLTTGFGQSSWVWRNQLPQGYSLNAVTWTGTQFVAVGEAGAILTSKDGVSWNVRPDHSFGDLNSVTWNGRVLVACGTTYNLDRIFILSSTDGATWERRYENDSLRIVHSMIWTGSQFAGIGLMGEYMDSSAMLLSVDGAHWTVSSQTIKGRLNILLWTGSQLVAVGSTGSGAERDSCAIVTSADGVTWKRAVMDVTGELRSVVWTGTRLVAVGGIVDEGTTVEVLTNRRTQSFTCLRQSTGIDHTRNCCPLVVTTVAALNSTSLNIVPGRSPLRGDGNIITSTDGITWSRQYPDAAYPLNSVLWANGQLIAVGGWTEGCRDTGSLLTSPDGITWTPRKTNCSAELHSVIWNSSVYIAYGSNGTILISPDGVVWTPHLSQATALSDLFFSTTAVARTIYACQSFQTGEACSQRCPQPEPVQSNGNVMVSVGALGVIATSADGITWKEQSSGTGIVQPLTSVFWTGSQLVVVGASGKTLLPVIGNCILTSPDGVTWTSRSPQVNKALYFVTGSPTQLLVVGDSGTILTSSDGAIWTQRVSGASAPLNGAAWTGSFWVVVGDNGTIGISSDGIEWKVQTSPLITDPLYCVIWTGKHLLAAGTTGIFSSTDGIVWTQRFQDLAVFNLTQTSDRIIARVNYGLLTSVSTDDTTWSEPVLTGAPLGAMTSIGTTVIAKANDVRSGAMFTSTDGLKWKPVAAGLFRSINSLTWTDKFLVGVGQYGAILTSTVDSTILAIGFNAPPSKKNLLHTFSVQTGGSRLYLRFFQGALKKSLAVSIYNLSGRMIVRWRGGTTAEHIAIELPAVAAGVYNASIEYDGQTYIRSFTIMR